MAFTPCRATTSGFHCRRPLYSTTFYALSFELLQTPLLFGCFRSSFLSVTSEVPVLIHPRIRLSTISDVLLHSSSPQVPFPHARQRLTSLNLIRLPLHSVPSEVPVLTPPQTPPAPWTHFDPLLYGNPPPPSPLLVLRSHSGLYLDCTSSLILICTVQPKPALSPTRAVHFPLPLYLHTPVQFFPVGWSLGISSSPRSALYCRGYNFYFPLPLCAFLCIRVFVLFIYFYFPPYFLPYLCSLSCILSRRLLIESII